MIKHVFVGILSLGLFLTLFSPVWAAEEETTTETPSLLENAEVSTGGDTPVPMPEPEKVIGDIELSPDGQAILSPEVIQALEDASQQPQKSEEELRREQWIRIGIDVAIGIGAALIFLAIWWLVKLKKREAVSKEA